MGGRVSNYPVESIAVSAYTVPTDAPEADGTADWDKTTLVLVEATAGGTTGIGWTYADAATAHLIHAKLAPILVGRDPFEFPALLLPMGRALRNLGRMGIASMAISAIDFAFWDLRAKLLGQPLVTVLGESRESVPVYGSGGFTSYTSKQLRDQLGGWVRQGIQWVKMKIGTHPEQDLERVRTARETIGPATGLFVDANGAYSRKQALAFAEKFAVLGVTWFEEPVPYDDLEGLHFIREHAPRTMQIAIGEYGYEPIDFRRMLEAQAADVLQADATRCGGVTGFLKAANLCESFYLPFSTHCAPALHLHLCCATTADVLHMEYFHDHVRIEHMLFDGVVTPVNGQLRPDKSRPGLGLEFKHADARKFKVWSAAS